MEEGQLTRVGEWMQMVLRSAPSETHTHSYYNLLNLQRGKDNLQHGKDNSVTNTAQSKYSKTKIVSLIY